MKHRKRQLRTWMVVVLALLPGVTAALELDLPTPPAGYTWQECPSMKGAVLVPGGWHFTGHESEGTTSYFITRKAYQPATALGTALTIDVMADIPEKSGSEPSVYAAQYLRAIVADKGDPRPFVRPSGAFQTSGAIFGSTPR